MTTVTGFIYLWRDSHTGMFYLGSHVGTPDDGYIGSGVRFVWAYSKRSEKFRRRILEHVTGTRADVYAREQAWLNLITPEELNIKYYNQRRRAMGRPLEKRLQPKSEATRMKLRKPKQSTENYHKPKSDVHRKKLRDHLAAVRPDGKRERNSNAKECIVYDDTGAVRYTGKSLKTFCQDCDLCYRFLAESARKKGAPVTKTEALMKNESSIALYRAVQGWRAVYLT